MCKICRSGNCLLSDDVDEWVHCSDCNRYFKSRTCYENHKQPGTSIKKYGTICKQYFKCDKCDRIVDKKCLRKEHDCTDLWCRVCQGNFPAGHQCYIKPVEVKDSDKDKENSFSYIFFDVASRQEPGIHKPNLCVAQKSCEAMRSTSVGRTVRLMRSGKTDDLQRRRLHGEEYDGYFILQFLYDNGVKPDIIMNGAKIMSIFVPGLGITFKDSLNFFPMALSKLPKSFGVQELCKGYFPHLFNTKENGHYVGEIPAAEFFDPEGMSEAAKDQFAAWHTAEKEKGLVWDLQEELLRYCVSDAAILRRCCMKFREMFMDVTKTRLEDPGVDPLDTPLTIASACNLVLRRNFLEKETIAIIPPNGYGPGQNFSRDSIQWLNYEALKNDSVIQHAMNGGEVRLNGRVTVDGIDFETRKIYSYQGCLYHGCPACYDEDTLNPISQKPMAELYRLTLFRKNQIEINYPEYDIVEIWEHEWKVVWRDLAKDEKDRIDVTSHFEPLNAKEALYGGRTEATRLFHQVRDGEVIRYLDFTSLYRGLTSTAPTSSVILELSRTTSRRFEYFGLIRCTVLPPRYLFHPVLPARCHGKLMFALCGTCMEEKRQAYCPHSDKARTIRGTWVTLEVQKAVEMGYEVKDIEVVWHWEQREYDKETKRRTVHRLYRSVPPIETGSEAGTRLVRDRGGQTTVHRRILENEGVRLAPTISRRIQA
ncbi:uncharacterized protein [Amphiura filiformis]|uniref:uncharacterized protein n=1 Tax=Amphiura filiformis TaxID=82378 RepID=UPI003B210904